MGYSVGYSRLYYVSCSGVCDSVPHHYTEETEEDFGREDTLFINTAHDIRTPLTLIKAPLEELRNKDMVNEEGKGHVSMALRNVDVLYGL